MSRSVKLSILVLFGLILSSSPSIGQAPGQNAYVRYMNAGSEQLKAGDYQAARESFELAVQSNSAALDGHLGLGLAYFNLRDDRNAERELLKVLEIDPKAFMAYQFLGELYYRKDDLETAVTYWEKAVAVNPGANDVRTRLERVRKEHKAERDFNRDLSGHFLIKYEGREKIEAGRIILRILEDAYGEVGRALSLYPDQEIQVILYSGQQFEEVTSAPGWSSGIFDGKIRMPIGGIEKETPGLRGLLYHEYTHAVVRKITSRCPTWLNEGLAQYFEGRQIDTQQKEMLKRLVQTGMLPSLTNLEGPFLGFGRDQAKEAYIISLSSVRYMIDSFGMYRIRGVLDELAKGAGTDKAISNSIMLSYEEFQRGWKKSLE